MIKYTSIGIRCALIIKSRIILYSIPNNNAPGSKHVLVQVCTCDPLLQTKK